MTDKNIEEYKCKRAATFGDKLMFFMIGGGIGAVIALLFAPKPGNELRRDIADVAVKSYDETLDAANRVKERTAEYYHAAKEKGGEVLDIVTESVAAIKEEISEDTAKIGGMVGVAAKRASDSVKSINVH